jgi:hypothetical protein
LETVFLASDFVAAFIGFALAFEADFLAGALATGFLGATFFAAFLRGFEGLADFLRGRTGLDADFLRTFFAGAVFFFADFTAFFTTFFFTTFFAGDLVAFLAAFFGDGLAAFLAIGFLAALGLALDFALGADFFAGLDLPGLAAFVAFFVFCFLLMLLFAY